MIDVTRIIPHLYMGSYPKPENIRSLAARTHTIVYCAKECPPNCGSLCHSVHLKMEDSNHISAFDLVQIEKRAASLAELIRQDHRIVVTCAQGLNRSGLVAGTIMIHLGYSGDDAVNLIQTQRRRHWQHALCNPTFAAHLRIRGNTNAR